MSVNIKMLLIISWSITSITLSSQPIASGCFDPGENDTFVTQYGGADLACPTSSVFTECLITLKNGAITSESLGCQDLAIAVEIDPVTGGLNWTSAADPKDRVDASLTDAAQGGKGCLYSYGTDKEAGTIGYQTSDGDFFPTSKAVFCSDGIEEVSAEVSEPAVVEECILASGTSQEIFGVTFSCPLVPAGETRTIIVTKDTECNPNDPTDCSPVPTFGFTDPVTGNIDFNNVCQCVGPSAPGMPPPNPVETVECDPDPNNQAGGCEVGEDAENPVVITIQQPKCFTIGGFVRCF